MKKVLFIVGAVVLLAAACNGQQNASVQAPSQSGTQNTTQSTSSVDAGVDSLNASVDSEQSINTQSDSDVINSDQNAVSGYDGVSNATY
ncbi:MAG TPA: hypothetical protein VL306_01805 [Methylomirabilota bacterium]|nr:hypothetical protein [Methylomirabilota bacterium]